MTVSNTSDNEFFQSQANLSVHNLTKSCRASDPPVYWESELYTTLWQTVPPVLLFIGLAGNILVMAVLRVMKFTQSVALFFFFIMALSDCSVLIVVLLHYWLQKTFSIDLRTLSDPGCKIMFFLTYFSMDLSSWTLAAVTVERCIVIRFSLRAGTLVTIKRARIAIVVIMIILTVINGYLLFTQRIGPDGSCGSFEGDAIYFFDEHVFVWIDLFVLAVLPFSVMLGCNIVIVREVHGNVSRHKGLGPADMEKSKSNGNSSVSSITLMLLAVNFYFLVTTIPVSVYFILDTFMSDILKNEPAVKARMDLVWTICYLLQFTNYSLNFYIYVARGRRFRAALWKLCGRNEDRDSMLESRRLASNDGTAVRRVTVSEGLILLRRGTVMDAISHFRRGTVADCEKIKRRATFADGIGKPDVSKT
ncbi:B1 bradykinin receptor-like [Liolophura sinensis]|uniref:B1 bradykinin receptor-like n=1 Tax=Liolophura sinensis TaxID=3198878 RepID=UPI0031584D4F